MRLMNRRIRNRTYGGVRGGGPQGPLPTRCDTEMKKAWRFCLAILGTMSAVAGLVVWDSIARAERAIEANEARLAAEIAELRAKYPSRKKPGEEGFS
jgi:hypothetical protein